MELTKQNIEQIEARLIKIGIAYADIRAEITDHVATAIEAKEGSFDTVFEVYMLQNKKQLKQMNRKMFFTSFINSHKEIAKTIVKPVYLTAMALLFAFVYVLSNFMNAEILIKLLFTVFCIIGCVTSILFLVRTFSSKYNYSAALGFGLITLILLYSSIFMLYSGAYTLVLLFYTFTIVVSIAMFITSEKKYKKYRLHYEK